MENVPDVGGLPVRMEQSYAQGPRRKNLTTVKISMEQLPEKLPPSLSGFSKARKSSEIFFGHLGLLDTFIEK